MTTTEQLWGAVRDAERQERNRAESGRRNRDRARDARDSGQISRLAYEAVIYGDITLERALSLGPSAPEDTTDTYHRRPPEGGYQSRPGTCLCGCGDTPVKRGSRFLPGHDARMHRLAAGYLSADIELSDAQLNYVVERGFFDE